MILYSKDWETRAHEPNPGRHLLLYRQKLKDDFYTFLI